MKKLLSVFLASALVLTLSVTALAAGQTVTIAPGDDFVAGVLYKATLSNVVSEGAADAEEVYSEVISKFADTDFYYIHEEFYIEEDEVDVYYCDAPAKLEMIAGVMSLYWTGDEGTFTNNTYLELIDGFENVLGDVTFTTPGKYVAIIVDFAMENKVICIEVAGEVPVTDPEVTDETPSPEVTPEVAGKTVNPTASTVYVNGEAEAFEAYTIDGNNYFKLRDLAQVLSGSNKQFEVEWDGENNAIKLTSGEAYTSVGGEMAQGDGTAKTANPTSSKIYLGGEELSLTVYTINGNNFFKLRDLMSAIDVFVGYDNETKNITVDTSQGYVAE